MSTATIPDVRCAIVLQIVRTKRHSDRFSRAIGVD